MPEKERAIDEFESIFERAHVPVPEIRPLDLDRLLVVLDLRPAPGPVLAAAGLLSGRFGSSLEFVIPIDVSEDAVASTRRAAEELRDEVEERFPGASVRLEVAEAAAVIERRIRAFGPQMVVFPTPFHHYAKEKREPGLGNIGESLLDRTDLPCLLVKPGTSVEDDLFDRVLAVVPGPFDLVSEFDLAFTVQAPEGKLLLLHVIDREVLAQFGEAFQVSAEVETEEGRTELIRGVERRMKAVLRGAVEAGELRRVKVVPRIEVGTPSEVCRRLIKEEGATCLICRVDRVENRSQPEAQALELARTIADVPVIAF